jgi:spore maturation protein CgeB
VAAGSSNPIYDLVTPKYFEIMAAGALLIGQACQDFETLGFGSENCLAFTKADFLDKIAYYQRNPSQYIETRVNGRI